MKALVIFDSNFGNTRKIAHAIAKKLKTKAVQVSEVSKDQLENLDLLVAGSPIIGWKPSDKMDKFLAGLKSGQLKNVKAATFDTRVKLFIHGDAAGKISKALENAGGEIIAQPKGFFVKGKEGPLLEGEIEKALEWASVISSSTNAMRRE